MPDNGFANGGKVEVAATEGCGWKGVRTSAQEILFAAGDTRALPKLNLQLDNTCTHCEVRSVHVRDTRTHNNFVTAGLTRVQDDDVRDELEASLNAQYAGDDEQCVAWREV